MKNIFCSKCNKRHSFSSTIDFGLPIDIVNGLMDGTLTNESSERWMIISNQYYLIKGLAEIPIRDIETAKTLSLLVWVMVSKKDFIIYIDSLKENLQSSYESSGNLSSVIQYFGDVTGLKVTYKFRGINSFPVISIKDSNSCIARSQLHGLSKQQVIKFIESLHHYDGHDSDNSADVTDAAPDVRNL